MNQKNSGLVKACFVTGIISDIMLILIDVIVLVIAAMMVLIGPIAFIFGVDYTDMFANDRVSSFCPAPMPWPVRVVAASAIP